MRGDHTGENQAILVAEVLIEYDAVAKFKFFVGDNASNNDSTFITAINRELGIELSQENRIRCAGHIINLVVKAIIYGDGVSKFEAELADAPPKKQFTIFRTRGVIGRLHNLVNAVNVSTKRRELFMEIQIEHYAEIVGFTTLTLLQDGGVRWHSVYFMLLRCWELRETIDKWLRRWRAIAPKKKQRQPDGDNEDEDDGFNAKLDSLTPDDWDEVKLLADFLQPFHEMTKRLEGNTSKSGFGSLWQTIVNLNVLDEELREQKARLVRQPNSFIKGAVNQGFEKLNTYWAKVIFDSEPSPYSVATVLHPRLRIAWFKQTWKNDKDYYTKVKKDMKATFEQYLDLIAQEEEEDNGEQPLQEPQHRKVPEGSTFDGRYERSLNIDLHYMMGTKGRAKRHKASNELEEYYESHNADLTRFYQTDDKRLDNPIQWWDEVGQQRYPTLYRMALDYLSIPSTSCDCERAFSRGRRTVTDDRNRLGGATIEALQLQKNWLQNKAVTSHLINLSQYIQRQEPI